MRNTTKRYLFCIILLCFSHQSLAQISVTAVQPPVWKETNGVKTALFPGSIIEKDEIIHSGKESRVLLDFNEGSIVELGEQTSTLVNLAPNSQNDLVSAAVSMLKGAFRYTAGLISNNRKRDIKINLTTATIGIRGTDLWGRSTKEEDFVVLIEGDILIEHSTADAVRMRDGQSVYRTRLNQPPEPLSKIEIPQLLELAKETALIPEKASIYKDGAYSVVLASSLKNELAINNLNNYLSKGYPAENVSAKTNGIHFTRTLINGFKSFKEATRFLKQIEIELGINDAWVLKRQ